MSSAAPSHDPGGKVRPPWPADSTVTTRFSDCQRYRYQLREIWDPARTLVLWLLMNPSVAWQKRQLEVTNRIADVIIRGIIAAVERLGDVNSLRFTVGDDDQPQAAALPAAGVGTAHLEHLAASRRCF